MNDLAQATDNFILSQYKYYRSLLPCQGKREANTIIALYQQYNAEAKARGLL